MTLITTEDKFLLKKAIILLIILFSLLIISCDDNSMTENTFISEEDYTTLMGAIPENFIHYGPAREKQESGVFLAHVVFESGDIKEYSGSPFSVTAYLTFYELEIEKNDYAKYLMQSSDIWLKSFDKLSPEKIEIGDNNSFIGVNNLEVITYKPKNPNSIRNDVEHIVINKTDWAIYRQSYPENIEKHLYGIYNYQTSIKSRVSIEYNIKFLSFDDFSHEPFLYAKKFIDNFYL